VKSDHVRRVLRSYSVVTVAGLADRLGIAEETVLRLCREDRIPVYVRAGSLWVRGRKPSRPAPAEWLASEKGA